MSDPPSPDKPGSKWSNFERLAKLLIGAIEPVARLIDAISRLR